MDIKIKVTIEKLIPGGKGLARLDGKVIFVPYVLPGEVVEINIIEEKKSFSEAELIRVIEKSEMRVEPNCLYYQKCGGCNMQHMSYETQLKSKSDFASNLLQRNGNIVRENIPVIPSIPYQYRNRFQVHLSGKIKGYKERSGNKIIAIDNCPVATGGVNRYLSTKSESDEEERITVFGKENWFSTEKEKEEIHITLNNKKVNFNSSLFFQSNLSVLPELSDYLNKYVSGDTLLDLYSGVGLLSSMVEEHFKKIKAVEINQHASEYIKKNIHTELDFYPMSVEKWINNKRINKKADTIIIDPPRVGLTKKTRQFLNRSMADIIIYVSCDPATLARDLKEIIADKYTMEDYTLFDFYPQTSHMEAVAILKAIP
jgi:23S rRNA (uracil1939-C5)-methyltransferase